MSFKSIFFALSNEPKISYVQRSIRNILEYTALLISLEYMLLMVRCVQFVVVLMEDLALYPASLEKELSNDTQQALLGTFAQSAKINKVWA